MAKLCPLFSGSTGNSTYISSPSGAILIDAGASYRSLCNALSAVGSDIDEISAVFITHHHTDHIKGLKVLLKQKNIPVFASSDTLDFLSSSGHLPKGSAVEEIESSAEVVGMEIKRFPTQHDCKGSGGYCVYTSDGRKISVCTDLGVVTDGIREALNKSDALLIESNHDINMLKNGPYPHELKIRIMSDNGHISNNACAAELPQLLENGTKRFILGHISRQNNTQILALSCSQTALTAAGAAKDKDYHLVAAAPTGNGVMIV